MLAVQCRARQTLDLERLRCAGKEGQATGNAKKLLLLAKSMAQKRLEEPDAAMPYQQSVGESAEAVRMYLQILQVAPKPLLDRLAEDQARWSL